MRVDAVHITTPHYLHTEMAEAALEAGFDVFLEKPVGTNEQQIEHLADVQRKTGHRVCVCFQNRFLPCVAKMEQIVRDCGPVTDARGVVSWHRDADYYLTSGWRGQKTTEGGGVMINQAIHQLDLLLRFCGVPQSIEATVANRHLAGVIDVEDSCEARFSFSDGKTALFYATTAYGSDAPNILEVVAGGHKVCLYGETLLLDGEPVAYEKEDESVKLLGKACWGTGHLRLISMFYDAIEAGEDVPVSIRSASEAVRVLLACYASEGRSVDL